MDDNQPCVFCCAVFLALLAAIECHFNRSPAAGVGLLNRSYHLHGNRWPVDWLCASQAQKQRDQSAADVISDVIDYQGGTQLTRPIFKPQELEAQNLIRK